MDFPDSSSPDFSDEDSQDVVVENESTERDLFQDEFEYYKNEDTQLFLDMLDRVNERDLDFIVMVILEELRRTPPVIVFPRDFLLETLSELPTYENVQDVKLWEEYKTALENLEGADPEFYLELDVVGDPTSRFTRKQVQKIIQHLYDAANPDKSDIDTSRKAEKSKHHYKKRNPHFTPDMRNIQVMCNGSKWKLVETEAGIEYAVSRETARKAMALTRIQESVAACVEASKNNYLPRIREIGLGVFQKCVRETISHFMPRYTELQMRISDATELRNAAIREIRSSYRKCLYAKHCATHQCKVSAKAKEFVEKLQPFDTKRVQKEFGFPKDARRQILGNYDHHARSYDKHLRHLQREDRRLNDAPKAAKPKSQDRAFWDTLKS